MLLLPAPCTPQALGGKALAVVSALRLPRSPKSAPPPADAEEGPQGTTAVRPSASPLPRSLVATHSFLKTKGAEQRMQQAAAAKNTNPEVFPSSAPWYIINPQVSPMGAVSATSASLHVPHCDA